MADKITLTCDEAALKRLDKATDIKKESKEIVTEGLDIIQNEQIEDYGANSNPSKPAGSNYRRTFRLRESSVIRDKPIINGHQGVWKTTGRAKYDALVLGKQNQQAAIHRGRWMSQEEMIKNAAPKIEKKAVQIIEKAARRI